MKVLVNKGDEIKEGDSLIVIEAMKMETNIVASLSGVVGSLLVKEGDQVKSGQLLLELE
ncbi:biotin/lipoyl-binding protein [Clostridium botulinum]|nr:biotin/lipoyl-binding protein [Clostridium botulinum]